MNLPHVLAMEEYRLDSNGQCQSGCSKAPAMVFGTCSARAGSGHALGASGAWCCCGIAESDVAESGVAESGVERSGVARELRQRRRPRHTGNHGFAQSSEGTFSLGG